MKLINRSPQYILLSPAQAGQKQKASYIAHLLFQICMIFISITHQVVCQEAKGKLKFMLQNTCQQFSLYIFNFCICKKVAYDVILISKCKHKKETNKLNSHSKLKPSDWKNQTKQIKLNTKNCFNNTQILNSK